MLVVVVFRLPRDIAQERLHTDIVQLLDEYNLVRSPPLPPSHMQSHMSNHALMQNHYLGAHVKNTGGWFQNFLLFKRLNCMQSRLPTALSHKPGVMVFFPCS